MLHIGFTNKYFTLWNIDSRVDYATDSNGKHYPAYNVVQYTYRQNLSMNEAKAIEKAKEFGCTRLTPDPELRGKNRSWEKRSRIEKIYEPYQFRFGKYEDEDIRKSDDVGYLKWYYGETDNIIVAERMVELDDYYVIVDGELSNKDEIEVIKNRVSKREFIRTNGFIEVFMEKNSDDHGTFWADGLEFIFNDYSRREYNGWYYSLPTINGKGKRVKNKTLKLYCKEVADPNLDGNTIMRVENFEILKK